MLININRFIIIKFIIIIIIIPIFTQIFIVTNDGNSTLSIVNVQFSHVGVYHCTATNTEGTANSDTATLKIACKRYPFVRTCTCMYYCIASSDMRHIITYDSYNYALALSHYQWFY